MQNNMPASPMMSFGEAVKTCFSKYANFNGRARRSEFWWFYLLNMILSCCSYALVGWKTAKAAELEAKVTDAAFSGGDVDAILAEAGSFDTIFFSLMGLIGVISLVLLIPTLAAWVRRLHDVGKSGHMLWLILLCGVGGLIPLIMAIPEGNPGPNQYGPSPKFPAAPNQFGGPAPAPAPYAQAPM